MNAAAYLGDTWRQSRSFQLTYGARLERSSYSGAPALNTAAADRFGVDARDILVEVGRRKSVGGQEDLVIEVAARLAATERPAAS